MATTINVQDADDFKSVLYPILVDITQDSDTVTDVRIIAGGTTYIKQITGSQTINVADYAKPQLNPRPLALSGNQKVWVFSGRETSVYISVDDVDDIVTDTVYCIVGGNKINHLDYFNRGPVLSDLPKRYISPGEKDEISFIVDGNGDSVDVKMIVPAEGTETLLFNGYDERPFGVSVEVTSPQSDFYVLYEPLDASHFAQHTYRVDYEVRRSCGVRLCWINAYGAIDAWTFDTVDSVEVSAEKEKIYTVSGWMNAGIQAEETTTVVSRKLPWDMIRALSQIVMSERAWIMEKDGTFTPIDIVTESAVIRERGAVSSLEVTYRPSKRLL